MVAAKSASLSPGKPTMKSDDSARSGRAARRAVDQRGDSRRPCSRGSSPPAPCPSRTAPAGAGTASAAAGRDGPRSGRRPCRAGARWCSAGGPARGSRPARRSSRARPQVAPSGPSPWIGVDVLAQQRELARTRCDQTARLAQDVGRGPALLGAARVGHDAEGAELVAAFLDGQEGADAAGGPILGQAVELALDRELGVDHGTVRRAHGGPAARAGGDRPAGRPRCRRRAPARPAARPRPGPRSRPRPGPGRAPWRRARSSRSRRRRPSSENTFSAAFSRMWQVFRTTRSASSAVATARVAMRRQGVRHTIGIVDVHLAAVGLDEEILGHVASINGITCWRMRWAS